MTDTLMLIKELLATLKEHEPCECLWCKHPEYRGRCRRSIDTEQLIAKAETLINTKGEIT